MYKDKKDQVVRCPLVLKSHRIEILSIELPEIFKFGWHHFTFSVKLRNFSFNLLKLAIKLNYNKLLRFRNNPFNLVYLTFSLVFGKEFYNLYYKLGRHKTISCGEISSSVPYFSFALVSHLLLFSVKSQELPKTLIVKQPKIILTYKILISIRINYVDLLVV